MKCPNCNETLLMTERSRVEIDYCPNCRGIWLDKGELDKLLEFSANQTGSSSSSEVNQHQYDDRDRRSYGDDRSEDRHQQTRHDSRYPPKKKKSFLSDFLDFD